MNHEMLLRQGVALHEKAHQEIARDRFQSLTQDHAKRIANVKLEKRLVEGDVWLEKQKAGERRLTSSMAHSIVRMASAMMLPQPPRIAVAPLSTTPDAEFEADQTTRWLYAALDNLHAFTDVYPAFAKETAFGAGILHMFPDRFAMENEEVPIIIEAPESSACLYHVGPRHQLDYCFVRYQMTAGDILRNFGTKARTPHYSQFEKIDVWAYYAEERLRIGNRTNRMILYTVIENSEFLSPLTDITAILPEIPVWVARNADGYNWQGAEHMQALGILTPAQSRLLYASDYMTQLAEGMIRNVNPPLLIKQDPNNEQVNPNLNPGGVTEVGLQEDVKAMLATLPNTLVVQYGENMLREIAESTIRHVRAETGDLANVAGSAYAEQQHPDLVLTRTRQSILADKMARQMRLMLRHLAAVLDPYEALTLRGVDPRDQRQILATATPRMLAAAKNIQVELAGDTPSGVVKYVTLVQQLAAQNLIPRQLATEQIVRWLNLKVTNMSDVADQIASDKAYDMKVQLLQQQAQEALPYIQQALNNQSMNPNVMQNGRKPYRMASQHQDPQQDVQTRVDGPVQQHNQSMRLLTQG